VQSFARTARQYDAFAFLRQHRASSLEPGHIVLNAGYLNIEALKKGCKLFFPKEIVWASSMTGSIIAERRRLLELGALN
jgi:hypothetical protein